jgi:hypothetical protein
MPGLIVHLTNVVEHPDLVTERLLRYADSSAATASWLAQIANLAKPARWLRARFHHVGEAKIPRRGCRHRLEAALALNIGSAALHILANARALAEKAEGLAFIDRRLNDLTLLKRNH